MKRKEVYNIKLSNNDKITFSDNGVNGDILLCGFIEGLFGEYDNVFKCYGFGDAVAENNMQMLLNTLRSGHKVRLLCDDAVKEYMDGVVSDFVKSGILDKKLSKRPYYEALSIGTHYTPESYGNALVNSMEKIYNYAKATDMKFDYIIQNPPYNKSLHLDFFEKGLDLLSENGKMTIIEPATWLINVRKNGKASRYDEIKRRIDGHVERVVIENLNKDFETRLYMPFATTTIDKSKTFDTIEFVCCGEIKHVNSIYDCNLVGNYTLIQSIIGKCQAFGDMMESHTTRENIGGSVWYAKYAELDGLDLCQLETKRSGRKYDSSLNIFQPHKMGEFLTKYSTGAYHYMLNEIKDTPHFGLDSGKHLTDKITTNIYGTKEELENWKHFIFNNKLPLFLNIVLTIDQNNNSKSYIPWLVDKRYTDEEVNKLFGFTDEEVKLINRTIEKYERNSPWFKRYMCGPDSVSDEEINNFIKKLNEKYA